jgi:hypothetical protein
MRFMRVARVAQVFAGQGAAERTCNGRQVESSLLNRERSISATEPIWRAGSAALTMRLFGMLGRQSTRTMPKS